MAAQKTRQRAREDGISFRKLGAEIGRDRCFIDVLTKSTHLSKIAQAVEFFGGKLVIDWQDE